ncbi:MAG: PKD domain-containing protein, partial [Bacteroidota bacterium]
MQFGLSHERNKPYYLNKFSELSYANENKTLGKHKIVQKMMRRFFIDFINISIFTRILFSMGRRLFLLISLILSFNSLLRSQVILVASAYEGCDSLSTRVFIEPQEVYDTLTDIIWEVREEIISSDDTLKLDLDAPGFYTVKAILNNQYVFSLSRDIQVYSTPRVDFSHSDTLAGNEFSYVFRSEFEESDSLNYIYTWYVNDEVIGYEPLIIHEFPESGEYTIGLS